MRSRAVVPSLSIAIFIGIAMLVGLVTKQWAVVAIPVSAVMIGAACVFGWLSSLTRRAKRARESMILRFSGFSENELVAMARDSVQDSTVFRIHRDSESPEIPTDVPDAVRAFFHDFPRIETVDGVYHIDASLMENRTAEGRLLLVCVTEEGVRYFLRLADGAVLAPLDFDERPNEERCYSFFAWIVSIHELYKRAVAESTTR
jgi:hypothetical protein